MGFNDFPASPNPFDVGTDYAEPLTPREMANGPKKKTQQELLPTTGSQSMWGAFGPTQTGIDAFNSGLKSFGQGVMNQFGPLGPHTQSEAVNDNAPAIANPISGPQMPSNPGHGGQDIDLPMQPYQDSPTPINKYLQSDWDADTARSNSLTGQGFKQPVLDQFVKYDPSQTQGSGFGKTFQPAGAHGSFNGSSSFSSPDIQHGLELQDLNRETESALAKQQLGQAQMNPLAALQAQHPDVYRQRLQAAAAVAGPPQMYKSHEEWQHAMLEALNAIGSKYDQNAINLGGNTP